MPRKHSGPVVFQIGFNRCGTRYLTELFSLNGYNARHWANGSIAEDIAYAIATDRKPLAHWPQTVCFANMECVHKLHRPPITAFKEYAFLHRWFPDAVFILNERDVDAWINSRLIYLGGQYKDLWAHHLGVDVAELGEIWRAEWADHIAAATSYFKGNPRFIRHNFDHDRPEALAAFLAQWFTLDRFPPHKPDGRTSRQKFGRAILHTGPNRPRDNRFVQDVVVHCLGQPATPAPLITRRNASRIYAKWDGGALIVNADGTRLPIGFDPAGHCRAKPRTIKMDRVEGVINEMLALGLRGPVAIDMQDARRFGTSDETTVRGPLLVYNRRTNAKNLVLWPLPAYHTQGAEHFVHQTPIDPIPFAGKHDKAVWRGNLTGTPNRALAPDTPRRRMANIILAEVQKTDDEETLMALRQELMGITRYSLVTRHHFSDSIDAAFALRPNFKEVSKSPLLSMFCKGRVRPDWFYKSKYILSLSGNDTGSNFLLGANSNSVVLKEEDGWELFYTSQFRPWEHYIPLELGALDIEEKLEWAKANPAACMEMSKAAREVCAKFATPANRAAILGAVFEAITARQNPWTIRPATPPESES